MYTIFDIADWFLNKDNMDHKKVQKLCYYAQAWSLALHGKPLMDCKFEAWAHGPVCRELWEVLRDCTYNNIPKNILKDKASPVNDKNDIDFLESVWETYKDFSGYQLEMLTHRELPWINARGDTPELQRCTAVISENDMRNFYKTLYSGDGIGE